MINMELRKAGTEGDYLFTAESAEDAETSLGRSDAAFAQSKQAGMRDEDGRNLKEAHAFPLPAFRSSTFEIQIV